ARTTADPRSAKPKVAGNGRPPGGARDDSVKESRILLITTSSTAVLLEQLFLPHFLPGKRGVKSEQRQSYRAGIHEDRRADEPIGEVGGHGRVQQEVGDEERGSEAD